VPSTSPPSYREKGRLAISKRLRENTSSQSHVHHIRYENQRRLSV